MNEQERLMLTNAAKAAGLKLVRWNDGLEPYSSGEGFILESNRLWNPYQDDAQCLQLARNLGITICYTDNCAYKRLPNGDLYQEYWGGDWWKTDRESVVAVAAQIGEMI